MPAVCTLRNFSIAGADAPGEHSSFHILLSASVEACFMQHGISAIYISGSLQAVLPALLPGIARSVVLEVRLAQGEILMQHTRS